MKSIVAALLGLLCFNTHAQPFPASFETRSSRVTMAKQLASEFQQLLDAIPVPRPKDVEWVGAEKKAIDKAIASGNLDAGRHINLTRSTEYQQVTVREAVTNLLGWLKCVNDAKELRQEVLCWSGVTLLMADEDYFGNGIRILRKANMIPASLDKPLVISPEWGMSGRTRLIGLLIHSQITMTYLRGELKPDK
ncbi:MAG: hypothetical protein KF766_03705 [Rhodocyclaceae bacterium]|nr:hypothetical protein [Rhodocyclaceae bacterium]